MATHITQNEYGECTLLSVSGEMLLDDATLLERIAADLHEQTDKPVTIDLADLSFLDSDAAAVLRRLGEHPGFRIEGMEIFLQSVVNEAEKR
jgi:anti-anti-sigma regulatory factor